MMLAGFVAIGLSLGGGVAGAVGFEQVFRWDALDSEPQVRRTLAEAFPRQTACAYRWSDSLSLGCFHDADRGKLLLHLSGGVMESSKLWLNGRLIEKPFTDPAHVWLAVPREAPGDEQADSGRTDEVIVGYWLPLKAGDKFRFIVAFKSSARFELSYDPQLKWQLKRLPD